MAETKEQSKIVYLNMGVIVILESNESSICGKDVLGIICINYDHNDIVLTY